MDFMIGGAYKECKAIRDGKFTVNDQIACAKGAITTLSNVDPTGILSIAGTFMRPVCEYEPNIFQ